MGGQARHERRYGIHADTSGAWTLVFDVATNAWLVEFRPHVERPAVARLADRSRVPLTTFEATEAGARLKRETQAAIDKAVNDV